MTQSKMFASSRGELTIQPDRSGHYVFQFVQISDANYKKVDLKGPSIDQVVHPPASADFVNSIHGGRGKKQINSCSGSLVDVDVELRVSSCCGCMRVMLTSKTLGHWPLELGGANCRPKGF